MTTFEPWVSVDPLTDALFRVRMQGAFYSWTRTTTPCALTMPPLPECLSFHVVAQGRVWLVVDGEEPVALEPGDVALVPRGLGHRLATDPTRPSDGRVDELPQEMVGDHYSVLQVGPPEAPTVASMLCGIIAFESAQVQHLMEVLPAVLLSPAGEDPALQRLVALMLEEVLSPRPGGEAVTTRLADVLVIQAVRSWLEREPSSDAGWLAALRDPYVGAALAAVHRDPGRAWTLTDMAAEAAMSRSSFAARFTELAGISAMQHVRRWRMHVARHRLREGEATVTLLATELGYTSDAAFSRAYKRTFGTSPGADKPTRPSVWMESVSGR